METILWIKFKIQFFYIKKQCFLVWAYLDNGFLVSKIPPSIEGGIIIVP